MMDWSPAVFGFIGALVGATVPSLLQARGTRRIRLEDAYAELAGACSLLLRVSIDAQFGGGTKVADEAWVRFGSARARVLLQENDTGCRNGVADLASSFNELYSSRVTLHPGPPSNEDLMRRSREYLAKRKIAETTLESLLTKARERLSDPLAQ